MNHVLESIKQPIKWVATINDQALGEGTDPNYELKYIDIGNVDSSGQIHKIATYRFEDAPSRARRIVRAGDVIISTVRTYLQAIAPIESPPDNLVVSTGFAVVRPRPTELDTNYCKYALREPSFLHQVVAHSVGVSYPAINTSELVDIPIYVPPLLEQRAIADYLDRKTAKLDALIAAMEHLLDYLAEKRRALITHAVTRGLNSGVVMRDSGVELLGEIPEHWDIARLKTVCESLQTGPFGTQLHVEDYIEDGIPVINPAHLINGKIVPDLRVTVNEWTVKRLAVHQLKAGDIIFARRGEVGRCGLVTRKEAGWLCGTGSLRARPDKELLNPEYLALFVANSVASVWLSSRSVGTTMKNLNTKIIGELLVLIPPLEEQYQIAEFIKQNTRHLDTLYTSLTQMSELVFERRAALIAAAVSGKINV